MLSLRRLLILAAGLASCVNAKSSTGDSVLVVIEPKRQDDFSIFFEGLKSELCRVSYSYICWAEPMDICGRWWLWTYFPVTERPVAADYWIWRVVVCSCYIICLWNEKWVIIVCTSHYFKLIYQISIFFWQALPRTLLPRLWFLSLTLKPTSLLRCQLNKISFRPSPQSFLWYFHPLEPLSFLIFPNAANLQHSFPSRLQLKIRLRRSWVVTYHPCGSRVYQCPSGITRSWCPSYMHHLRALHLKLMEVPQMPLSMLLKEVGKVCGLAVNFLWLLGSRH